MMKFKYNDKSLKGIRKTLRKNMTEPEIILWSRLKGKQLYGYKFRRQQSIGKFIVDFYCPKLRFAIEVDGGQHNDEKHFKLDEARTIFLNEQNITVIRFWNHEVLQNTDDVLNAILFKIEELVNNITPSSDKSESTPSEKGNN